MALSAFDDKNKPPQESDLAATLGRSYALWNELREYALANFAPLKVEWGCSSKSIGWGMRLQQEKRMLFSMVPCKDYFLASFALGEKAVAAARQSDLPAGTLAAVESAPRYAEGRGVRLEIRSAEDERGARTLAAIKFAH